MNSNIESELRALEYSTLKAPYENLNKNFRNGQKYIEKENSLITNVTDELGAYVKSEFVNISEVKHLCEDIVNRLQQYKRKAEISLDNEINAAETCKKRIIGLKDYSKLSEKDNVQLENKRLNRMIVEHLLQCNQYSAALKLAEDTQISDLTNIDLYLSLKEVYDSLYNKSARKCLEWCNDNKSKLKRINSSLEFTLRQQEFIELIKQEKRLDAIKYAKKHFQKFKNTHSSILQQTMGLLAFPLDTEMPNYRKLLDDSRWLQICEQFKMDSIKMYNLGNMSRLSVVLQAGISSLKTESCYLPKEMRNPLCPICASPVNKLALQLPSAYCSHSKIFCFISKEPIDENNLPFMLPNGFVYGMDSLKKMAAEYNGKVICPRTKQIFDISDAKRVYVM